MSHPGRNLPVGPDSPVPVADCVVRGVSHGDGGTLPNVSLPAHDGVAYGPPDVGRSSGSTDTSNGGGDEGPTDGHPDGRSVDGHTQDRDTVSTRDTVGRETRAGTEVEAVCGPVNGPGHGKTEVGIIVVHSHPSHPPWDPRHSSGLLRV